MKFTLELKEFEDKAIANSIAFIRLATLEIYKGVTVKSPVDTGRFKGNWNTSYGTPNFIFNINATASGFGQQLDDISKVAAFLQSYNGEDSIFIANGLPYGARLESGYSRTQAPLGFVDVTLVEFKTFISKQIAKQI